MRTRLGALCALLIGTGLLAGSCGGDSSGDGADASGGSADDSGGTNPAGSSSGGTGGGGNANGGSIGQGGSSGAAGSMSGTGGTAGMGTGGDGGGETGGGGNGGAGAGTAGTGGRQTGGAGANGGNGGSGNGGRAGASAGNAGAAGCPQNCSMAGLSCCGSQCTNTNNDVKNCGGCGRECSGTFPYCNNGTCGTPPCTTTCGAGSCCESQCCTAGQLCCLVPGGPSGPARCVEPVNDSCPPGCPNCPCASPDTPIATPSGERPISALRPGDLVYSIDGSANAVVPIKSVNVNPVVGHYVLRIMLASGVALEISAMHPTADGRTLAALQPAAELDGVQVLSIEQVPYAHAHTYDILPDSDTGTYYAGGVLIGSTLFSASHRAPSCVDAKH